MTCRFSSRKEWLAARKGFIGGSDASAIIGQNPYKTNLEVWKEKTGQMEPEDIGHKSYVRYGIDAERHLTALFALDYPQYEVKSYEYKIIRRPDCHFIGGTLDGELVEKETGRKGILEVKTTEILRSRQWESWKEQIPNNYYIQVLHYLLATGWDFAILKAQLKTVYDGDIWLNTRHYYLERAEVQEDLDYLLEKEVEFWRYVEEGVEPPLTLPPI